MWRITAAPGQRTLDLCRAKAPLVGFQVGRQKRRWQIVHNRSPKVFVDLTLKMRRNIYPKGARVRGRSSHIICRLSTKSRFMWKSRKTRTALRSSSTCSPCATDRQTGLRCASARLCVRVCAFVCVRVCVCVWERERGRERKREGEYEDCERACVRACVCVCGRSCWKRGQNETRAINVGGLDLIC